MHVEVNGTRLWFDVDGVTPVVAAREIYDALPDGIARLEVIEGAGHFPWKDAPDEYWPLLNEFVRTATVTRARLEAERERVSADWVLGLRWRPTSGGERESIHRRSRCSAPR